MDPRDRADAMLARARARGRNIVTPDNMTSPMDASDTLQIPRGLVNAVDPRLDPDSTMILPPGQMRPQQTAPMPQQQHVQQQQYGQHQHGHQQHGQHQRGQQQGQRPMPTQPFPVAAEPSDDADVTQVVQPGMIPTVSHHQSTRSSLSQRLDGGL